MAIYVYNENCRRAGEVYVGEETPRTNHDLTSWGSEKQAAAMARRTILYQIGAAKAGHPSHNDFRVRCAHNILRHLGKES